MDLRRIALFGFAVVLTGVLALPATASYTLMITDGSGGESTAAGGPLTYTFEDYARWDRHYTIYGTGTRTLTKNNQQTDTNADGTNDALRLETGDWWLSPWDGDGRDVDLDWDGTSDFTANYGGFVGGESESNSAFPSATYLLTFERGRIVNGPGADFWVRAGGGDQPWSVGVRYDIDSDGTKEYYGCGGTYYDSDGTGARWNNGGLVDLSAAGIPDGALIDAVFIWGSAGTNLGSWGQNVGIELGGQDEVVDMNGDGTIEGSADIIHPSVWTYQFMTNHETGMGVLNYVQFGAGDIDGNGNVGLGDFSLFSAAYGKQAEVDWNYNRAADLDENRNIGLGDFSLFSSLYGSTYSYALGAESVPEPVTLVVLGGGLALAAFRRRSR